MQRRAPCGFSSTSALNQPNKHLLPETYETSPKQAGMLLPMVGGWNQLIFKVPFQPNQWFCVFPTPAGNCSFNTTQEISVKRREESSSPRQLLSAFLSNFHSQLLHQNVLQSYLFLSCPVESLWISHVLKTNYFKLKSSKIYLSKFWSSSGPFWETHYVE